ncbi:MAG: NUDIX hydrolase [Planctomycetes bacterium]|nr:NUDIX hydrolase [Planctomycetota bacterium]
MRHDLNERFCARCGSPLADRAIEGRLRRACSSCSHVVWIHPTVGAVAAVVERGELLLIRRRIEPFRGHWTMPAGYVEIDETPAAAVTREVREETGLEVVVEELLDVVCNDDDPRRRGLVVAYLARPVGGRLLAGDDAEEARFFRFGALPEDLGFANNRWLIEQLRRRGLVGSDEP